MGRRRRRLLGEHLAGEMQDLGEVEAALSLHCRPGWGRGHRRTREGRGEGAF